jgi:hypothetical protein
MRHMVDASNRRDSNDTPLPAANSASRFDSPSSMRRGCWAPPARSSRAPRPGPKAGQGQRVRAVIES